MKDQRVMVFRKSLEDLVESLDATLRLARWDDAEAVPEPLKESAARLVTRLGTTDRLSAGVFKGNPRDVESVGALTQAMKRLESAYVVYRKGLTSVAGADTATDKLAAALEQVKHETLDAGHLRD